MTINDLRDEIIAVLEPFARDYDFLEVEADTTKMPVRIGDLRRAAALLAKIRAIDATFNHQSEGGGKDAPIAASGSGETADPPPVRSVAPSVPEPAPASDGSQNASATSDAIADVLAERARQITAEGWTAAHDDGHRDGELAIAASCYANPASPRWKGGVPGNWPWRNKWWKPKDRRSDLVRAGALIIAEIERLDRLDRPKPTEGAG